MKVARARKLRANQTDTERALWRHLRALKSRGFHFRRQAPIGNYVVDFACHAAKLAVELDGGQHNTPVMIEADQRRTEWLDSQGYRVVRFWNNEVLNNIEGVMYIILASLEVAPHP